MIPKQTMNSFNKGMIKDVADNFKPRESYEDALDIRLNSNGSDSEYTVTNIKGTEFSFVVPDVPNIVTITPDNSLTTWTTHHPVLETSTGVYTGIVITTGGDADDLFVAIENALKTDPVFAGLNLNVARIGQRIRVWSTTEDVIAYDPSSNLTDTSLQTSQSDQTIIGWDNINDDIYLFTTNDTSATGGIGAIWKLTYDQISLVPT